MLDDASGLVAWPFVALPLHVIVIHVQYLCYGC